MGARVSKCTGRFDTVDKATYKGPERKGRRLMAKTREIFITGGAEDLRAWLDARGLSITRFCDEHDLDRIEVQRHLRGLRDRVSVDFAVSIRDATKGSVKVERWAHSEEVRRKLFERRSRTRRKAA